VTPAADAVATNSVALCERGLQYLGSLMALITLTVILFSQVIIISMSVVNNSVNGTYEYDNIQFICNSNNSITIVSIIGDSSSSDPDRTFASVVFCHAREKLLTAWLPPGVRADC